MECRKRTWEIEQKGEHYPRKGVRVQPLPVYCLDYCAVRVKHEGMLPLGEADDVVRSSQRLWVSTMLQRRPQICIVVSSPETQREGNNRQSRENADIHEARPTSPMRRALTVSESQQQGGHPDKNTNGQLLTGTWHQSSPHTTLPIAQIS